MYTGVCGTHMNQNWAGKEGMGRGLGFGVSWSSFRVSFPVFPLSRVGVLFLFFACIFIY